MLQRLNETRFSHETFEDLKVIEDKWVHLVSYKSRVNP